MAKKMGGGCARQAWNAILLASAAMGPMTIAPAAQAQDTAARRFDIPAQPLADALVAFGIQSGLQVTANGAPLRGIRTQGVSGTMAPVQALSRLLSGTGFTFRITGDAVTLERAPQASGDSAIRLGPVRVEGQGTASGHFSPTTDLAATEGSGSYTASGPSMTATGLSMSLRETPQSVTVVTRQKMDDFGLETLADVLEQAPGVTVTRQGSAIDFGSRGNALNLRIDGNRHYTSAPWYFLTSSMYSLDDIADIDRIEIVKGSTGLTDGDGYYGGTINLIRKRPTPEFQASLSATGGSWNSYRADADISGPVNASGTIRARGVAAWRDAGTFRDHESEKNVMLYGTVDIDLTPDTLLNLGVNYKHRVQRGYGATRPVMAYNGAGDFIGLQPRSFNPGAPWAGYKQDALNLFGSLEHQFANGWTARLQFGRERIETPEMRVGVLGNDHGNTYRLYFPDVWQRNEFVSAKLRGPFDFLGRTHELVIGAGASSSRTRNRQSIGLHLSGDQFPYDYAAGGAAIPRPTADELAGTAFSSDRWFTKRHHVYAAGRFSIADPLHVIAGIRVSSFDQRNHSDAYDFYNYSLRERGVVTPYGGITLDVLRNVTLYGSYARIFQAQNALDVNGNTLPPLRGITYETGVKGEFFDKRLNASLSYFWMKADNEAEATGEYVKGTTQQAYRPVMGATRRGFEVEISGEILPGWQTQGSFALNDSSLNSASRNPKHQFKLNSSYSVRNGPLAGLSFGGGLRWQSAISVANTAVTLRQDAYWLADMMARYQVNERLTFGINADNLLDKRYFSGVTNFTDLFYTWGEPRNVKASVQYRF
ncbi:TonB-dependent siderophore receptor [Novosphingobium beihaiensis]|uniref:TonB-dependent receptor n=1 Tax=Novosphingobium beihaiensis TaxID=2930389 RepID=A0ABT0BP05_9SPHN|nr:TonB-dependent receptor [Novosphingobium beihaiensis]MCJ2186690.1 TonB-dependent receptor [Novosphingobium beihaiensis]